jgi:hypothetical protein
LKRERKTGGKKGREKGLKGEGKEIRGDHSRYPSLTYMTAPARMEMVAMAMGAGASSLQLVEFSVG